MGSQPADSPIVDTSGYEIRQIGLVVRDAVKTAKRYSQLFGLGPWMFIDLEPTEVVLHDQGVAQECCVRCAMARLGDVEIELIQPMYGPSTHAEFLARQGEGVHHLSFSVVENHDAVLASLRERGIGIEMAGTLAPEVLFSYLDTRKQLGTIFELVKAGGPADDIRPWGSFSPEGPGVVSVEEKRIIQVGFVVDDAEKTARNYWELFGMGPWMFIEVRAGSDGGILHGVPTAGVEVSVKIAMAQHGNMQLELIEPVYGPTTHMEFLKAHGSGIHHLSFGEIPDHDEAVAALGDRGIEIEMAGILGGASRFTYMATQEQLGTIFEMTRTIPGAQSSLAPYGFYPS